MRLLRRPLGLLAMTRPYCLYATLFIVQVHLYVITYIFTVFMLVTIMPQATFAESYKRYIKYC